MSEDTKPKTPEQALEEQRKQAEERAKVDQNAKDMARLVQIKSRIKQQFQSPNSPYRGVVTSPEEQRMIDDQAKLTLRKEKKALVAHESVPAVNSSDNTKEVVRE